MEESHVNWWVRALVREIESTALSLASSSSSSSDLPFSVAFFRPPFNRLASLPVPVLASRRVLLAST
jgi:hypothetical protein